MNRDSRSCETKDPAFVSSKSQQGKRWGGWEVAERIFKEIITENVTNLSKNTSLQIQKAEQTSNHIFKGQKKRIVSH